MAQHNVEQWELIIKNVVMTHKKAQVRHHWLNGWEPECVKHFVEQNTYLKNMIKPAIGGRIAVTHATTFDQLLKAIDRARKEIDAKFDKVVEREKQ